MLLNTKLLARRAIRMISGKRCDFRELAEKKWVLCPEEKRKVPKPIYLEGNIEKITGLSPWRTWEGEKPLLEGGVILHAATTGYLLRNVSAVDSHLYLGAAKLKAGHGKERVFRINREKTTHIRSASLVSSSGGGEFFGMFMRSDIPLSLLEHGAETSIALARKFFKHADDYMRLLGVERPITVKKSTIDKLTIFSDYGQNVSKADRYQLLRDCLKKQLGGEQDFNGQGIYISRGDDGERRLLENEEEITEFLKTSGIRVVNPSKMTAADMAKEIFGAQLVISVEGSHLAHAIYAVDDRCTFLVLQPPDRFALAYKEFTDRMDMKFAFLVGTKSAQGFTIDKSDLGRLLDIIDRKNN